MASNSVGQIGLDLVVNQDQFKKQMSGVTGLAKKAGAVLAAAFAVKKIWDFGAACIALGSDLDEVQNVVDVTFPTMARQVDGFAKAAASSFGLSETMAKRFTGTFGAMAKAFGFNEHAAYEMSTSLTALSGDVASFYNISQDAAFSKLKSVFTGETIALKDLGIVMSQASLDQYALANGFGKTTAKMSEAEKVALRYKFVTDQLSLASGDFTRTSGGWANQVRLLKLQFDSLKATIGQGLINVLTPVIRVINAMIGKLMSLANAFKSLTDLFAGKKSGGGGAAIATAGMEAVAGAAGDASGAVAETGDAAKKAAKDIKGATTGIDELNVIQPPDAGSGSGEGGGGGGGGGGYAPDGFDMGGVDTSSIDGMDGKYQGLIDKARELAGLFRGGFNIAFGNTKVLDDIKKSVSGIGLSLKGIFTNPDVLAASDRFGRAVALNLGKIAGSATSIGASVADNLLGGLDKYLDQNSQRVKDYLASVFDTGARGWEVAGDFSGALATVFEAFRSDGAKQITSDVIGVFSDGFMGATELAGEFAVDVADVMTAPFIKNKDKIKKTLEDTFGAVEPIFAEIKSIVDESFGKLKATYDKSIKPMFESFKKGFTEITDKLLDAYNQYILPVINELSKRFGEFHEKHLSPLIDKFMEFSGKVAEAVTALWQVAIKPFIEWFIANVAPIIGPALSVLVDAFFDLLDGVSDVLGRVFDALGGLMDFITGVLTGDWQKAWTAIKTFFSDIWEAMKSRVETLIRVIHDLVAAQLESIKKAWDSTWGAIRDFFTGIWEAIKKKASGVIEDVRKAIDDKITAIKAKWDEVWGGVKSTTENVFSGMWNFIKGTINNILCGVETMANGVVRGVNKMIDALNSLSFDIPDWVPGLGGKSFGFDMPTIPEVSLPRLAQGGFVKANTPRLAMIGDNRHHGEIVAPEDKMQAMVDKAVAMASRPDGMSERHLSAMVDLLKTMVELVGNLELTVNFDTREIKKKLSDLEKRSGYGLRPT